MSAWNLPRARILKTILAETSILAYIQIIKELKSPAIENDAGIETCYVQMPLAKEVYSILSENCLELLSLLICVISSSTSLKECFRSLTMN